MKYEVEVDFEKCTITLTDSEENTIRTHARLSTLRNVEILMTRSVKEGWSSRKFFMSVIEEINKKND